jgi:hypothetical protein
LTGTPYQQGKYNKHTGTTGNYPVISTFDNPSEYSDLAKSASASGFVVVDPQGRTGLVFYADKRIGETTGFTQPQRSDNAVIFVNYDDSNRVHGYPTAVSGNVNCSLCGCLILS